MNRKEKGKTKATARTIPVHLLIEHLKKLKTSSKDEFLIRGINSVG